MAPFNGNLLHAESEFTGKKENFRVESPALNPLQGENCLGSAAAKSLEAALGIAKSQAERNAIAAALERTGWNRKAAARMLKVSYRTMLYKIEQYRMTSSDPFSLPFVNGSGNKANGSSLKGKAHLSEAGPNGAD